MKALVLLPLALAAGRSEASPPANTAASKQEVLWTKLEARVGEVATRLDGVMGVAILDLASGRLLLRSADEVFPVASSIKLPLLVELYRQEQQARKSSPGTARLGDSYVFDPKDLVDDSRIMAGLTPGATRLTNRDLAQFVVAVSDNAATNVLIDRVGMANVNGMLRGLGLGEIKLRRKMMDLEAARRGDENVATPRQMVELLRKLYRREILEPDLTEDLLRLLSTPKKSHLPRLLPAGVAVANKSGELEGVRTDSGIVLVKDRPFAISVMTAYDRDELEAETAIGEVALLAYRHFEILARASEYGRVISPGDSR
jgi:beta-lactamase class A